MTGGAQQGAQGAGGTSLASDDFAYVAFGDFEFDDVVVEFLDENFVRRVDQRLRNQFNQRAHISGGLSHSLHSHGESTAEAKAPSDGRRRIAALKALRHPKARISKRPRRRSRRWPEPELWRTVCARAPTSVRLSTPSTRRDRASSRRWRDWCGDCRSRPLPPGGRWWRAPSQSRQCDSAVVCAHRGGPDGSL